MCIQHCIFFHNVLPCALFCINIRILYLFKSCILLFKASKIILIIVMCLSAQVHLASLFLDLESLLLNSAFLMEDAGRDLSGRSVGQQLLMSKPTRVVELMVLDTVCAPRPSWKSSIDTCTAYSLNFDIEDLPCIRIMYLHWKRMHCVYLKVRVCVHPQVASGSWGGGFILILVFHCSICWHEHSLCNDEDPWVLQP